MLEWEESSCKKRKRYRAQSLHSEVVLLDKVIRNSDMADVELAAMTGLMTSQRRSEKKPPGILVSHSFKRLATSCMDPWMRLPRLSAREKKEKRKNKQTHHPQNVE